MLRIGAVVRLGKFRLPLGWEYLVEREEISSLRIGILGWEGLFFLRRSRSWIRGLAAGGREGS